ncbi:HGGxSTG domain-containing protein [Halalkalibaculum sp. DA3122]|uniref:HGGxSTG domain-containing protein n=1 Tax=Halalkalibaculum sp. DA3122 TaxID=3373607 RepID=UPI0037543E3C
MADDKQRCGAKCRDGSSCNNWAMPNGKCRLHGGKSLKGKDSKTWKSGIYSRYASKSLKDVLDHLEDVPSEELLNADNELRLLEGLISNALKNESGDLESAEILSKIVDRLVRAKQRAVALKIEEERLIPAEDVKLFLSFIEELLLNRIDEAEAYELLDEMQTFQISEHATN